MWHLEKSAPVEQWQNHGQGNVCITHLSFCPVSWGCRIHRLLLCSGVPPTNECPGYDTKQSDSEVPVMLELWGMQSTPSLPLLPGPLWQNHCQGNVCITHLSFCPASWGCRIHRLLLCSGVPPPNECPGYDTKQSDSEVPVMLELWGVQSTPSLLLLPGPLCPRNGST